MKHDDDDDEPVVAVCADFAVGARAMSGARCLFGAFFY